VSLILVPWYIEEVRIVGSDCDLYFYKAFFREVVDCNKDDCLLVDQRPTWPQRFGKCQDYDSHFDWYNDCHDCHDEKRLYLLTFIWTIIACSSAFLSILVFIARIKGVRHVSRTVLLVVCVFNLVWGIVSVIYFTGVSNAVKNDMNTQCVNGPCDTFWGNLVVETTTEQRGYKYYWGPGPGWMLAIVGAFASLLTVFFAFGYLPHEVDKEGRPIRRE